MEEYRYAEHRALYAAEAGLNEVGVVILPQLVTEDTLLYPQGKDYGDNENGMPIGRYKNIYCHTELEENVLTKRIQTLIAYVDLLQDKLEDNIFTMMKFKKKLFYISKILKPDYQNINTRIRQPLKYDNDN